MQQISTPYELKWFKSLFRWLLISGVAVPVGWLIIATAYRWQQNWSETYFLVVYLLCYITIALLALLVRYQKSELPEFTLWGIAVFSGIGLGRIVWWLVQYEHHGVVHFSLNEVWLTLIGGVISLLLFYRWEVRKDRRQKRDVNAASDKRPVPRKAVHAPAVSAQFEEVSYW